MLFFTKINKMLFFCYRWWFLWKKMRFSEIIDGFLDVGRMNFVWSFCLHQKTIIKSVLSVQRYQDFFIIFNWAFCFLLFSGREMCHHIKRHLWPFKCLRRTQNLECFSDAVSIFTVDDDKPLASLRNIYRIPPKCMLEMAAVTTANS